MKPAPLRSLLLVLSIFSPAAAQDPSQPGAAGTPEPVYQLPTEDPGAPTVQSLELALEDALRLAARNNLQLQIDQISTDVASYGARGAWGAFEWVFDGTVAYNDRQTQSNNALQGGLVVDSSDTQVDLNLNKPLIWGGSFDFLFQTTEQETTSAFFFEPRFSQDTLRLTYTQPLNRGFGRDFNLAVQREQEILFRRQVEMQRQGRQDLGFQVYNAYWNLVDAREQLGVADSSLELGLEQLEQNRRRLDAGVGTEVEVLQSEADVANRIELLLLAQNNAKQSMDDLKLLLFGSSDSELWDMELISVTPLPTDDQITTEGIISWNDALLNALDMRSELRQVRFDVDIARVRHKRSMSERLSGVDLRLSAESSANATRRADALAQTIEWRYPSFGASLNYNMPIGNKTANYNERSARANVRSALLVYDQLELSILAEVRAAVRDVIYRAEAVRAAVESLELADRQLEAERARYAEGLSTNFEVLQFQQDLTVAQSNERTSRMNYAKALVEMKRAQGLIGEAQP